MRSNSIKLDRSCDVLRLNNYEIAFKNKFYECNSEGEYDSDFFIDDIIKQLIITCYNYQTVHTKKTNVYICLDTNGREVFSVGWRE